MARTPGIPGGRGDRDVRGSGWGLPAGPGVLGRDRHLSQCCLVGREQGGGGHLHTSLPRAWPLPGHLAISPPQPESPRFLPRVQVLVPEPHMASEGRPGLADRWLFVSLRLGTAFSCSPNSVPAIGCGEGTPRLCALAPWPSASVGCFPKGRGPGPGPVHAARPGEQGLWGPGSQPPRKQRRGLGRPPEAQTVPHMTFVGASTREKARSRPVSLPQSSAELLPKPALLKAAEGALPGSWVPPRHALSSWDEAEAPAPAPF